VKPEHEHRRHAQAERPQRRRFRGGRAGPSQWRAAARTSSSLHGSAQSGAAVHRCASSLSRPSTSEPLNNGIACRGQMSRHSRECTPCGQWACYARSQQPKARGVPNHPGRGTAQAVEKSGSERPAWVVEIIGVGSRSTRLRACSVCIVVALWAPPSGSRKWMEVLGRMRVLADRAATQSLAVRLHLRGGRLRHPS